MTRRLLAAALIGVLLASCAGKDTIPAPAPETSTTTLVRPSQSTSTTTSPPAVSTTTTRPVTTTTTEGAAPTVATTTTVPRPTAVVASLPYVPDRDGFSFENFGGGEAPAELTVNMTRRFYGDGQVCSSVEDNECTPYPVILQLISQANRSMRGGLCEGLTVLSLRLANDPVTLASFQNVDDVAALVKADPALLSEIAYWYVTQFATEVQEQASAFLELSPLALARILYEDFAAAEAGEPSVGYTVGIYSEHGGHAVTPYKVTTDGDRWRIYIYDSNWPTSERWIDVDEDGWVYALAATNPTEAAEAWGGGTGTMELTPMISRSGPFTCGFCPTEDEEAGTMLTVAASGSKQMSIQIETESGDRLGYYDGTFINEIEGATYRYLISGPSTADPVLVFLPPGVDDFSADVDVIDVPTPASEGGVVATVETPEQEPEEDTTQEFSLLILDEDRSVQIEANIVEEPAEQDAESEEAEPQTLIEFTEEAVEIADIEEATVAIAVDALEVEIEIEQDQQIQVEFAPQPPPLDEPVDSPGVPVEEAPEAVTTLGIEIADRSGEVLAEAEVDLTPFRVEDRLPDPLPVEPGQPDPTIPPTPAAPVVVEITFDEDTGVVEQHEEVVEAWVASDAEYFQAVAEDRVEEVLGESYVTEIEERNEWEAPPEFDDAPDLAETLIVEDDYWEDEQWEEVSYDEEYFEEEAAVLVQVFAVVEEEEWWGEEPEVWAEVFIEEHEDDRVVVAAWEPDPEPEVREEPPPTTLPPPTTTAAPPTTAPPTTTVAPPTTTVAPPTTTEPPTTTTAPPPTTTTPPPTTTAPPPTTTAPPPTTTAPPPTTTAPPPTTTAAPPTTTVPPPTTTAAPPTTTIPPPTTTVPPPTTTIPPPTTTAPSWDQYAGCRGTSACQDPPAGFGTWDDYDAANDPAYYDDWGVVPVGFTGWAAVVVAVEAGEVDADVAGDVLPDFVVEQGIVEVYEPPPVYQPTITSETTTTEVLETLSTLVITTQTGTATSSEVTATNVTGTNVTGTNVTGTNVTEATTSILSRDANDGHWHTWETTVTTTETTTATTTQTTTETTTATTVTDTFVDTTSVVSRAGVETVTCTFYDGIQSGCSTQRTWDDEETTVTASDPYTESSTTTTTTDVVTSATADVVTTATTTASEQVEQGCSEGGWTGMGDWCIVSSGSRNDYDYVQFSLDETTDVNINAESNLTYSQFVAGNHEYGDPYIYLNADNDPDVGAHSGDASQVTLGTLIESDDDGGRDCPTSGNSGTCQVPNSSWTDPDETPTVRACVSTGTDCTGLVVGDLTTGVPVIDNVSDTWDSRIERLDLAAGDYVVRGSVYSTGHDGWYRLTISEAD